MRLLYSVAEIRSIEQAAAAVVAPGTLMQRAGAAASKAAQEMAGHGPVLIFAGPGNNGGDALEAAADLALAGWHVTVIHCTGSSALSAETAHALSRARAGTVMFADDIDTSIGWTLVIDGLFGIGLTRPLAGRALALVTAANQLGCPILALDVPSGLDADTGAIIGPEGVAVVATHTLTFIADKPGLHTYAGRDHAGAVTVAALGIDAAMYPTANTELNHPALFAQACKSRQHNSHKGSFGDVVILGGAEGMTGAAILAARGALYGGAGRVMIAALGPAPSYDSTHPEIMVRSAADFLFDHGTCVAGPGMGAGAGAIRALGKALDNAAPLVLDADAINLIGASLDLQSRAALRTGITILTPHPLEAARLLGVTAPVVQADRLAAAREIAARLQAVVVLKGSGTVIANAQGHAVINQTGNPGLATGGTGDVLAGVCGALLAQGCPAWQAALGAVWMHGQAADDLVALGCGPVGLTAGELPAAIRTARNRLVQ